MRSLHSWLIGIAVGLTLLWSAPVYANATCAPSYVWFKFEGAQSAFLGAQLAECQTQKCTQPIC